MQKPTIQNNDKAEIRKSYSPEPKDLKVLEHIYTRFQYMKDFRGKFDVNWDSWRKQWESYSPGKKGGEWQSKIVATVSTSIVETIMAEFLQHQIEPPVKGRGEEDLWKENIWKEAIKFSAQQGSQKIAEADIKKEALILGQAFGEELLWQNKREVRFAKFKWEDGKKISYMDKQTIFDYDGMLLEHVPADDLWFDEAATTVNVGRKQANDAVRQFIMTKEAAYDFLSDPRWNERNNLQYVETGKKSEYFQFYQPPERIDPDDEVQVLFYWSKRPDMLAIVANDVLIFEGPNPYNHKLLPFVQACDIRRTNSLYHKGEMELLSHVQEELTFNRRMRMNRTQLSLDPMFAVSSRSNLTEDDLLARPHGMIETDELDGIKEVRVSDTPVSAYKEEESLLIDAQRLSGVDDGSQAIQRTSTTATEFAGLRESTLRKVAMKLWYIHNGFYVDHARLRLANILQFWTVEKYERVVGSANMKEYEKLIETYKAENNLYSQDENQEYSKATEADINSEKPLFRKTNQRIRTEDVRLIRKGGKVERKEDRGSFFFDIKPEEILPYYGGFDIQYDGTPEMPLTKALLQTKWAEVLDRVLPVALSGAGGYDPVKLIDKYIKVMDEDPDHFKTEQQNESQAPDLLELAQLENQQMMEGKPIPPTPNSTPSHSKIHTAFMKSKLFQDIIIQGTQGNPEAQAKVDLFTQHVTGESMAQQARAGGSQGVVPSQPGQQGPQQTPPPEVSGTDGRIQGGEDVEQGLPKGGRVGSSPIGNIMRRLIGG